MKKRYLNKESASYKFKWEVLKLPGNGNLDLEGRKKLWEVYLYHLKTSGLISNHSAKTWIYPEKLLKEKKK